ncbi:MAG TPA: hypothetical protein DEF04_09245 [Clostridiales bacterium]|nr:hypothetical protein [Clostridiales bacterium]
MLLFRMGPRHLFIRSENIDEIASYLEISLKGEVTDFPHALEKASEYSTICFITGINHEKTYVEDALKIVLINDASTVILSAIINSHICHLVHKIDMGPATIIMRMPGNEPILIDKIKEVFGAKEVDWYEGIGIGEKDDTIIGFTDKVLGGPVSDFFHTKLLIPQPVREVQGKLRLEGLRLITQSLNESHWYELRINIYDSCGKYKENYDRLMFILSKLEIGMILGESWTKDYAVMLYSVLTYQVRLFTFFTPQEVKKVLVALEYTLEGDRMVDFDLYYKNKKLNWGSLNSTNKRKSKPEASKEYRKELYEKLKPEDVAILENMEKSLRSSK